MGKDKKLSNWSMCMTHGDVVDYVLANGGKLVRISGSHWIFRGPTGRTFPIQHNHPSWRMVPGMKGKIKRELIAALIPILEDEDVHG